MMPTRALISKLSVGLLLLVAAWALLGAVALYWTHKTRIEAGDFLRDLAQLEIGKSELGEVTPLVDKYHGKWRKSTTSGAGSPCGQGASVVDFMFENRWLHWSLFAPLTGFSGTIYVKDNRVCFRSMGMVIFVDGIAGVHVQEFRESPVLRPFSARLNPVKTIVTLDVGATTEERGAAFSLNLDCLTKLRGCRDAREMAPALWKNSREVAPTYWKSQWDD